jgi:CysZ protein
MANRPSVFRELFAGAGLVLRGLRMWSTAPKLMLLGIVPAVIVATVILAGLILFALNLETIAGFITPFADDWDETVSQALRLLVAIALFVLSIQFVVVTFTALTLGVGDAFYERIWLRVEQNLGDVPVAPEVGFWRSVGRGIGDSLRLLVPTALIGVLLFLVGLIPVVGQVASIVTGAFVGGWFLAVELTGRPFDVRGFTQKQRRRMLGSRRALTLGFGVATWLLFLVPFGAILVMPGAVAGATLLSRRILNDGAAR